MTRLHQTFLIIASSRSMITLLKYSDMIEARLEDGPQKRKGDRTRDRLRVATIRLLEEEGSGSPRITDICERAGVAAGTFYLYFQNTDEIVHDVLSGWVETIHDNAPPAEGYKDAFDAMYVSCRRIIELFAANSGLMQSLWKLRDKDAEFAKIWERNNLAWYQGVQIAILKFSETKNLKEENYTLAFYVISSMMDEFLRTIFVSRDPALYRMLQNIQMSSEEMAEYLAVLWYRIIYGRDPGNAKRRLKYFPAIKPRGK